MMKNRESLNYLNYYLLLLCYCSVCTSSLVHAVPTEARRGCVMP